MRAAGTVVHVIAPSPAGGAESVVVALASAARDTTQVVVLNQVADRDAPPHPMTAQLQRHGVTVEEIRCGRRRYGAEARALEEHLRRVSAALVHTHGYHGTVVAYFAAKDLGIPLVSTVHGYLTRSLKERVYNVIDRLLLRRFQAVIAVSHGIREQLLQSGLPPQRVHLVQNGMAAHVADDRDRAREALGLDAADRVVGWIGRLSPEKGPDLFLRAYASSGASGHAVIVGDGPEQPRLRDLAQTLGLDSQRVVFAGFRPNAAELLTAFDVLALTSRMEGTPMVILEAVARGVPIVSFAIGGIPDLLNNDSAWLAPPENVDAIAESLRAALGQPDEARRRATNARERLADRLSIESWVERISKVYDAAVSSEGSPT
ncbi:MAG: glycosyltransferase [Gemmatimonadaceae bacterium]